MAEIISMPKLGFDMAEGTLVRWVKLEGEAVQKGDVLAEIETDKATVEVESSFSGVVVKHLVERGSIVPVGTPIAVIAAPGEKVDALPAGAGNLPAAVISSEQVKTVTQAASVAVKVAGIPTREGPVKASPLAKQIASENQLDLSTINGSGPAGRIVKRDVQAALAAPKSEPALPTPAAVTPVPVASFNPEGIPADQVIAVDKLRAAIARRMVESKTQLPHFYVTHEYNVEALLELRKEVNGLLPDEQKLSVNDFIVKAVGLALRRFPNLNSSLTQQGIVRHGHIHVGVAVALENGLMTVVCRDTDIKPLRRISGEVKEMVARARLGKVRPEDIEGSTFSISNLGMYDVEHFIAIINPPEAAILAVGSAREVPVVADGLVRPGMRLKATISIDHRVSDGAEGARFMQALAEYIETPMLLML